MSFLVTGIGTAAGAALGYGTIGAVAGAAIGGGAGLAVGGLMGGSRGAPQSASGQVQYNTETLYDKLLTQSDPALASALYNREANEHYGRPAYARLEQSMMRDAIVGKQQVVDADGYYTDTTMPEIPLGGKVIQSEDEAFESYVRSNPDLLEQFEEGGGQDIVQFGREHYESFGQSEGRELPTKGSVIDEKGAVIPMNETREFVGKEYAGQKINTGGMAETVGGNQQRDFYDAEGNKITRRAGFDEDGNFQGTAQFATDIAFDTQQQNVQQELGLVEQYGQRATDVIRSQGDIKNALNKVRVLDEVSAIDGMSRSALHMNDASSQPAAQDSSYSYSTGRKDGLGGGGGGGSGGASDPASEYKANYTGGVATQPQGATTSQLRNAMLSEAIMGMNAGGSLTGRESRAAQQTARSAMQARGRVNDFGGIMAEMEMNERYRKDRRQERFGFAGNVMNAEQALMDRQTARDQLFQQGLAQDRGNAASRVGIEMDTSADAFKAILNKDSGAGLAAGTNLYNSAGSAKSAGSTLYNPHTGLQFEQNQAANQDTYAANIYQADQEKAAGMVNAGVNLATAGIKA